MEKTNCILVHGCPGKEAEMMNLADRTFDKHWMPWAREKLESQGMKVEVPLMPEPWAPDYEKFKREFEKYFVGENTILIGHSCGCAFLVRWLGESKARVKKLILVAPWKIPEEGDAGRVKFYVFPIDGEIKERVGEIVMFTADDEEKAGKESLEMYQQALGGKIIELKGHGHYTMGDMGTNEFPELIEAVLKN